jgi:lipopolysaccharide export system permease protein
VFWSILHRTIFWELTKVFLLSLLGITGILLMAGIVAEASRHGLGPAQILAIMPLIVPSTLPYTIPATTLFATCVVYGRLAADNEILAIRAAGVNLLVVIWPAVLLGVLMSAVTVGLYWQLIPTTHHMMRAMVLDDVEDFLYAMLRQENCLKYPKMNYELFVKRVQGRKLLETEFKRRDPKTKQIDLVARAREAELNVHMSTRKLLVHMRFCNVSSSNPEEGQGWFEDRVWPVDLPEDLYKQQAKNRGTDMTWRELHVDYAKKTRELEEVEAQIVLTTAQLSLVKRPEQLPEHLQHYKNVQLQKRCELLNLEVEMHMRPAVALGCLCFVLVGCPVGIWFSRSDYLSAFITCFLPIVFVYYPLLLCGLNMAKGSRQLPVVVSVWAADGLMALVAAGLFRRLLRN